MSGTLYLIPPAAPDDLTLRAARLLRECVYIFSPNLPYTAHILSQIGTTAPHAPLPSASDLLKTLQRGDVVIFDPCLGGEAGRLVQAAIQQGVKVCAIPGEFVPLPALLRTGFANDSFVWLGELPSESEALEACLSPYVHDRHTLVLSLPEAQPGSLRVIERILGTRTGALIQGKTLIRGQIGALLESAWSLPLGQIILTLQGAPESPPEVWDETQVRAALETALQEGVSRRTAAKRVAAQAGWDARAVYDLSLKR
ncbi:MAG: hypothetical protein IT322_02285 [Anaerolineae bacterium]|nr:hypothetical protein [Anaerolineae bacterium]